MTRIRGEEISGEEQSATSASRLRLYQEIGRGGAPANSKRHRSAGADKWSPRSRARPSDVRKNSARSIGGSALSTLADREYFRIEAVGPS